ncbi:hypothetical protein ACTFIY_008171 [Dictyostelium cf. discoideum]
MKLNLIKSVVLYKLLLLLLLFLLLINFINGYEYINFIPYSNDQCSGDVSNEGVGYAIVVDTCFTLDNATSHIIQVIGNTVAMKNFYDVQGATDCVVPIEQPSQHAEIGDCIPADFTFNLYLNPISTQPLYYFVMKSSQPSFQSNSYVTTFMSESCDDDQVLLAQYIMNDTRIAYGSKANLITFFCDEKTSLPYTQFCPPGSGGSCFPPIAKSLVCFETLPFFNSSSDEFPSTNGGSSGSVVSTGNPGIGSSMVSTGSHSSSGGADGGADDGGGSSGSTSMNTGGIDTSGTGTGSSGGTGVTSGDGGDSGNTGSIGTGIVSSGRRHFNGNLFYRSGGNGALRNKFKSEPITIKPSVFLSSSSSSSKTLYYTSIYCE